MRQNKPAEETALSRYRILAPVIALLEESADSAKISQEKRNICEKTGISDRTLRRWLAAYREFEFEGLKPTPRLQVTKGAVPPEILKEAIILRREVPGRSIAQIIEILEMEGKTERGQIKRTTLQDHMTAAGYSSRQMKLYNSAGAAARRFERKSRNDLWHSDIKYGPYILKDGKKQQIYLVSFIDDATRYVIHAEFYDSLEQSIVEDCFRKAVMKEGAPRRVYFDNGKQFRTKWMERACALMGIRLIFAKPYSPESTGKVERFNRTVDSFMGEVKLKRLRALDEYNHYLSVWVQESYHTKIHSALKDTPQNVYKSSKEPHRFLAPELIAKAFLHEEQRKVDKSGCISFEGEKYEVGLPYIGCRVNIIYDPQDKDVLTVEHIESHTIFPVKKLVIGEHSGKRPKLPEFMTQTAPQTSRLLDEKEKQYTARQESQKRAIRYGGVSAGEGGELNV
jgi:transposase InsO family protein